MRTISDSEWQGFCRATGDPGWPGCAVCDAAARAVNATARINKMQEYIGQHTTAEWLERLDAADVPCAPILRRGEIINNEQVVARSIIVEFDQPTVGRVRQPKPAAQFRQMMPLSVGRRPASASTPAKCCAISATMTTRSTR